MKAAEEIGDGWRFPTKKELKSLNEFSTWNDVHKGRYFGKNKELFLPALGHRYANYGKMIRRDPYSVGWYWSSSLDAETNNVLVNVLCFDCADAYNEYNFFDSELSVRLVRNIKNK